MRWLAIFAAIVVALGIALYAMTRDPSSPPPRSPAKAPALSPVVAPQSAPVALPPALPAHDGAAEASARRVREAVLSHIRDPHVGHEGWNEPANRVLDELASDGDVLERGCYMAGCFATVQFASEASEQAALARAQRSPEFVAWTGAKRVTPVEESSNGKLTIALVLERPD